MAPCPQPDCDLLIVGMSSKTYRIGTRVRKQVHSITDDDGMTAQNLDACITEANVYLILGSHPLIAQCLFIGPQKSYIELEFYYAHVSFPTSSCGRVAMRALRQAVAS